MSNLGEYNFLWIRGTTTPLKMSFMVNAVPIAYDDIRLSVYKGKKLAFRLTLLQNPGTGPGTVTEVGGAGSGVLSFNPTAAQTRALIESAFEDGADGGKNSYEVEVRVGSSEDVFVFGKIAGIGGLNDDEVS